LQILYTLFADFLHLFCTKCKFL